jgi:hypothetical protein
VDVGEKDLVDWWYRGRGSELRLGYSGARSFWVFFGGLAGNYRDYGPAVEVVNRKFTSVPLLVPPPTDFLMAVGHVSEG